LGEGAVGGQDVLLCPFLFVFPLFVFPCPVPLISVLCSEGLLGRSHGVVQWGIEYLARCKDTDTKEEAQKFASYKDIVSRNKKKREAGFLHFKVTPFRRVLLLRREKLVILIRV
jgi:hypothetical protein